MPTDPRTDPTATMRHWRVEVNFEAWDEEDADRLIRRIMRPLDEEQRLIFVGTKVETNEFTGER